MNLPNRRQQRHTKPTTTPELKPAPELTKSPDLDIEAERALDTLRNLLLRRTGELSLDCLYARLIDLQGLTEEVGALKFWPCREPSTHRPLEIGALFDVGQAVRATIEFCRNPTCDTDPDLHASLSNLDQLDADLGEAAEKWDAEHPEQETEPLS